MRVNGGLRTRGGWGAAGFVPTCPSLNPRNEEKTVDRNLKSKYTSIHEPQREAVWII